MPALTPATEPPEPVGCWPTVAFEISVRSATYPAPFRRAIRIASVNVSTSAKLVNTLGVTRIPLNPANVVGLVMIRYFDHNHW